MSDSDGLLVDFGSVVDAVMCAAGIPRITRKPCRELGWREEAEKAASEIIRLHFETRPRWHDLRKVKVGGASQLDVNRVALSERCLFVFGGDDFTPNLHSTLPHRPILPRHVPPFINAKIGGESQ